MHQKAIYLKSFKMPNIIFNRFFRRPPDDGKEALLFWRKRIFLTIFFITIFIGIFPLVSNINISINSGQFLTAIIYTLIYSLVIIVTFARAIPFKVRVWTGLFIFYAVGFTSTMTLGLAGSGRMYFFAFSVLACLLLGLKAGFITLTMNVISFFFLGWLLNTGYFE